MEGVYSGNLEFGWLVLGGATWAVLSDEQMSKIWPFSLLNDEQMSNKVRVEHQPATKNVLFRNGDVSI